METMIRVKRSVMDELRSLFDPGEVVEASIPCGPIRNKEGSIERVGDRDYLVITQRRFFYIRGDWFRTHDAAALVTAERAKAKVVDVRSFLIGSNITFEISDAFNSMLKKQFTVGNCSKHDAEVFAKFLTPTVAKLTECPACGKKLDMQFAFCPYCKFSLKRVCQSCGRELQEDWVNCPFCGK